MYVLVVFRILIKWKAKTKNRNKNHYNIININKQQTKKKSTKYYFSFRFDNFLSVRPASPRRPHLLKPCAQGRATLTKKKNCF